MTRNVMWTSDRVEWVRWSGPVQTRGVTSPEMFKLLQQITFKLSYLTVSMKEQGTYQVTCFSVDLM